MFPHDEHPIAKAFHYLRRLKNVLVVVTVIKMEDSPRGSNRQRNDYTH